MTPNTDRSRAEWLPDFAHDVRYAARAMRQSRGTTFVALVTLTLGIGATTAIFTVVNALLLRPLPYPAPDRLVALWQVTSASDRASVSIPNFRDWQADTRSFAAMATVRGGATTVLGGTEPTRADAYRVSGGFFRVLGTTPLRGRAFLPEDARVGAAPVAVVSASFWQRALGGGSLAGRRVELAGRTFEVVGGVADSLYPRCSAPTCRQPPLSMRAGAAPSATREPRSGACSWAPRWRSR